MRGAEGGLGGQIHKNEDENLAPIPLKRYLDQMYCSRSITFIEMHSLISSKNTYCNIN
jgi:hypothetical protein